MFSRKKTMGIEQTRLATLIAEDVRITGDLQFSEGLRMDGQVKGNVSGTPGSQALLVLSDRGSIEGNVHGYDVVVNGKIVGDLIADHFVELQGNAHVVGNIYYHQLRMDCGASVDGKLTRREAAQVVQAAPPLLVTVDESLRGEHYEHNERTAG
ncbi:polymer-forming cytoskeletal protein [Paraburkholderia sediminicola]|uniref:Polymer-forming cytoskeletal protein n=1 Tax=Paraburkholderia rhynchosiae TaxID=487049 RepID=A0ACC7N8D3_9BURK